MREDQKPLDFLTYYDMMRAAQSISPGNLSLPRPLLSHGLLPTGVSHVARLILLRILESYFRHRWLYLLPIALMIALAMLSFVSAKTVYISRGVLYVQKESLLSFLTAQQSDGFSWVTPAQATTNEFKELLQTDAFVRSVIASTGLERQMSGGTAAIADTFAEARNAVWLQTLGDHMILIGAAHGQPLVAQQLVSSTIDSFIQWKTRASQEGSASAQSFFANLIDQYRSDLQAAQQDMEEYIQAHPAPLHGDRTEIESFQIESLKPAIDVASTRLKNALDKEESARLAMTKAVSDTRETYPVMDAPPLPAKAEGSKKDVLMNSLIFVVVGMMLSVMGVVGSALLDHSVRFPIDVRNRLDLPVLATVPAWRDDRGKGKPKTKT
jgi:capsular polysaccharide biosynthesis protein